MQHPAKYLVIAGLFLVTAGLIWWFAGDKFNWIGKLPGDMRVEKPGFRFYFPITTMILFSLVVSFLTWLFRRFL